ncbi:MAG: SBBP repeat-containing protein, partial [Flavisolibacter sp.]
MKSFLLSRFLPAILCLAGLLRSSAVCCQVFRQWVRVYEDNLNSQNFSRAIVADDWGNVYVTGTGSNASTPDNLDYVTIKYNASGTQEWIARYDGFNRFDGAESIAIDKKGNIYVTGSSEGIGTGWDFATIKYNNAGVQQWVARFNGPGNVSESPYGPHSLKVDNNGNVYVIGMAPTANGSVDFLTVKYNNFGVQQWAQYYNGPANGADVPFAMAVDSVTSDVYVTGFTTRTSSDRDYVTVKYNSAGIQQWVRDYNMSYLDEAVAIGLDAHGNVYITGHSVSPANIYGAATIKYDPAGNTQWVIRYEGPDNRYFQANDLGVDPSGNVFITGYSPIYSTGSAGQLTYACATIKYNGEGVQQWAQFYDRHLPSSYNEGTALTIDNDGNIYVAGVTDSTNSGRDFLTIKYNSEGVQKWAEVYEVSDKSAISVTIAVNKLHDVFIGGTAFWYVNGYQQRGYYTTIKYAQPAPLTLKTYLDTTLYYGYGSNCVELKTMATGGMAPYSFSWSPGGTTPNNQSTTVCATANSQYTVTVKDAIGQTATDQVRVNAIDVRCGNKSDKVVVCHNGNELCIDPSAVSAHLKHGDNLGSCSQGNNDCDKLTDLDNYKSRFPFIFKAYPNPFNSNST